MQKVLSAINKIDNRIILLILLALHSLGPELGGNEEQYLVYLKKFYDPSWMPYAEYLNDFPGTRIVFQYLFGWLFEFFNFETVAIIGRTLQIVLIAFPIAKILTKFKITNVGLLAIIPLWLMRQAMFGGGYMIGHFETKTFAYIFSLWAVVYYLDKKYWHSIIFQILAFHFHMLVGGWASLVLGLLFLIETRWKTVIYYGVFIFFCIPFLWYISNGLITNAFKPEDVNLNWVYTYYRNPHHTTMFKSMDRFYYMWFWGLFMSLIFTIIHYFIYKRTSNYYLRKIALFNCIIFCQHLVFVVISIYDKNGDLLKTYPHRTSVFFKFFSLVEFASFAVIYKENIKAFISKYIQNKLIRNILPYVGIVLILLSLGKFVSKRSNNLLGIYSDEFYEATKFAKTTPEDAVFMISCKKEPHQAFHRISERPCYVMEKLIPTEPKLMYNWYLAMEEQKKVEEDINYLGEIYEKENIDYLITNETYETDFLEKVFENKKFFVYKLK